MLRLLATSSALLLSCSLAFAEQGEVPQETVGTGGIVAFFVVCIVMVAAFIYLTNKSSKKSAEERAGDKVGQDK